MGKKYRNPKLVPFYGNHQDNIHCLQACVKMALSFYFPDKDFTDSEIDEKTLQFGGNTWFPPAANWLYSLGISVELFSQFDYAQFAKDGDEFLKKAWSQERYQQEQESGALDNCEEVSKASQEMCSRGLWRNETISVNALSLFLHDAHTLAIGKTFYPYLAGAYVQTNPHYVLVRKEYMSGVWSVHDPGLPPHKDRKVPMELAGYSIFSDVLILSLKQNPPRVQ